MKFTDRLIQFFFFFTFFCFPLSATAPFVAKPEDLKKYYHQKNAVLIASTGRSGSTLLTAVVEKYAKGYTTIKTHLLPPNKQFEGKIIFIFSNPDKAAESALNKTVNSKKFGDRHFCHLQTAEPNWLQRIGGDTTQQTATHNLLSCDALGCYKHLVKWLKDTIPCQPQEARILAIKYESLWDPVVTQSIKDFLGIEKFILPPYKPRGSDAAALNPKEIEFRSLYNVGTPQDPKYKAYDRARALWESAPVIQYLK
jgi:hypothetical protein